MADELRFAMKSLQSLRVSTVIKGDVILTFLLFSLYSVIRGQFSAGSGLATVANSRRHVNEPFFFLIGIVGGGVQLGPLGTAAANRPIVPAPCDYDDGEIGGMIGRGNRSARRKPAPVQLCPPPTPHAARTRNRAAAVGSQRLT
jgi:hypothetical protein